MFADDFNSLVSDMREYLKAAKSESPQALKKRDSVIMSKVRKVAKKHGVPSQSLFMDVTNRAIQLGV